MKKLCFVLMMTLCMSQVAALGLTKDLNHEVDGIRDQLGTAREFLVQQADELDRTLTTNNDYNNLVCL